MSKSNTVEFCILNIAANPHPVGIYVKLFEAITNVHVNYRGNDYATISRPLLREDGYYQGKIVCWTDIDTTEPAINKNDLSENPLDELGIDIPPHIGLNGRVFLYTLREKDHKLFVECKNELGKRLSPTMIGRVFKHLFDADRLGADFPTVEVTVIPDEDTLKRIFSLSQMTRLKIHMVRPNSDDINDDVEKILQELADQNAKSQDTVLTASSGHDGLKPNQRHKIQAQAAEINGYVEASGKEEDGTAIRLSTKEHPKIIKVDMGESRSLWGAALAMAKAAIVRQRNSPNL